MTTDHTTRDAADAGTGSPAHAAPRADLAARLQAAIARHPLPVAGLGAALCTISAWVTVEGGLTDRSWLVAAARVLMVAVPLAVGVLECRRRPGGRFGALLVLGALVLFLETLVGSSDPWLYSTGRVALFVVVAGIPLLVLTFPSGRLPAPVDRRLALAVVLVPALLYLPTALVVHRYPTPSVSVTCSADCPANAFEVISPVPGVVDAVIVPARELLTVALAVLVALRVLVRLRRASWLTRMTLAPVLVIVVVQIVLMAVFLVARRVGSGAAIEAIGWAYALLAPGAALAFLFGLWRRSTLPSAALQQLAASIALHPTAAQIGDEMRDALHDPTLEVAYASDGSAPWVDATGNPVALPEPGDGRAATIVRDGERRVAALVHDEVLCDQPALLDATAALVAVTLENQRLAAETRASLDDLRRTQARATETADAERRRLERDLHDGAQQRLVAIQIQLQLAADLLEVDPARWRTALGELRRQANAAMEEMRSLARGVYPARLEQDGLVPALHETTRRSPRPVELRHHDVRRHRPEVEKAVYFCCLEAVQNAIKHGGEAVRVTVTLTERDGNLRFDVADDGVGADPATVAEGSGLDGLRDRLAAVGGTLTVTSEAGAGTRVSGAIPVG